MSPEKAYGLSATASPLISVNSGMVVGGLILKKHNSISTRGLNIVDCNNGNIGFSAQSQQS